MTDPTNTPRHPTRRLVAVAIQGNEAAIKNTPSAEALTAAQAKITAAGRGKIAEQILDIAFTKGIKVRQDADLAELLAQMELDTPIPSEAIIAVAEILAKVYEANNKLCNSSQNDPFSSTDAQDDSLILNRAHS